MTVGANDGRDRVSQPEANAAPLIYRLGGSLLDLPSLGIRLRQVVELGAAPALLLVGGGRAADVVREWDRIHSLSDEDAHWLAIEAMRLCASLVVRLIPELEVVCSREEAARAWTGGRLPVLDVAAFLQAEEAEILQGSSAISSTKWTRPLERSWEVTSDSIAAWVAHRWPAAGLVLLKSVTCPVEAETVTGDRNGEPAVDPLFSPLMHGLPFVGWANLRDEAPSICEMRA